MALRDGWMESSRHRNGHARLGRGRACGKPVRVRMEHRTGTQLLVMLGGRDLSRRTLRISTGKGLASSHRVETSG